MSNISTCLTLAEKMWSSDVDRVLEAIDAYLAAGFSQADAQRMAVDDLVAGIQAERVETEAAVREQHADLFDENLPTQPEVEPVYFSDPAQWSRREFNREYMQPGAVVDTPEFKRWFGDSVITRGGKPGGEPMVMYHGTASNIDAFDDSKRASSAGFYFTERQSKASMYAAARAMDRGRGANVMPVFLRMVNPKRVDFAYESEAETAKAEGHDGLITRNEFVVFEPQFIALLSVMLK